MVDKGLAEWRKERLQLLADEVGGQAELGRLLRHKNGSQIGHMLSGRRPISEKTIYAIEALPGRKGWFSRESGSESTATAVATLIREERNADPYELIERGLGALVIVGLAKEKIMVQIREAARVAAETQQALNERLRATKART